MAEANRCSSPRLPLRGCTALELASSARLALSDGSSGGSNHERLNPAIRSATSSELSDNAKPASDVASARLRARCPPLWAGRPCPEVRGPDAEAGAGSTLTRLCEEGWERTTPV